MTKKFSEAELKKLWKPETTMTKFGGGQVTIIGGSSLFHGAPLFALRTCSRLVDMTYFSTPNNDKDTADELKSSLGAFIWVPRVDLDKYVAKSDANLIGCGMMRYSKEGGGKHWWQVDEGKMTKELTEGLLRRHFEKKWVIDGGSLQVMDPLLIPKGAVLTPNTKEFEMLFGESVDMSNLEETEKKVATKASEFDCVIALKGPTTIVSDGNDTYLVDGGSPGLSKGGTGDVVAGLTVALLSKNDAMLSAAAANFLVKRAGEELEKKRGVMFNADDVAEMVPMMWKRYVG